MYKRILIPLDNSPTDTAILEHVRPLAKMCGSSLVLVHVADGFVARNQEQLNLGDSEEIEKDRAYLADISKRLGSEGFKVSAILKQGDPAKEILALADSERCDLIAMATHGHRFLADLLLGSVAEHVRHRTAIPMLMLRAG